MKNGEIENQNAALMSCPPAKKMKEQLRNITNTAHKNDRNGQATNLPYIKKANIKYGKYMLRSSYSRQRQKFVIVMILATFIKFLGSFKKISVMFFNSCYFFFFRCYQSSRSRKKKLRTIVLSAHMSQRMNLLHVS